jgi:hypothetical protein
MEAYPDEPPRADVLGTAPVSPRGWTDLTDVRLAGEKWVRANRHRPIRSW